MASTALETETLVRCPICNYTKSELVITQPDNFIPVLYIKKCSRCGVIYLSPRLILSSIISIEDKNEVYNFSPALAQPQIDILVTVVDWLEKNYVKIPGRRLLDIGCSRGLLMEAARRQGWQVSGVEISPEYAQRARDDYGLTVYSRLDEVPTAQKFDLISAWHVLEHTHEPVKFLQQAAKKLTSGGILAIQVPSFDYVDEFRQRDQLSGLLCAVHNFYFTAENIRFVLKTAGLKIIEIIDDPDHLLLTAICTKSAAFSFRTWVHEKLKRQEIS